LDPFRSCDRLRLGGVGARHALFPRTLAFGAQSHPLGWFPGCQFPDAALNCTDICRPFRLRSGAGPFPVSLPRACRARLLSSSVTASADGRPPNPVWARLRIGRARTCFRRDGIPPKRDRWPYATGLTSYPSSCVFLLKRATLFSRPPALGCCCESALASRPGRLRRAAQSVMDTSACASRDAIPGPSGGRFFVRNRPDRIHHTGSQ
jgi:hypothetical protein